MSKILNIKPNILQDIEKGKTNLLWTTFKQGNLSEVLEVLNKNKNLVEKKIVGITSCAVLQSFIVFIIPLLYFTVFYLSSTTLSSWHLPVFLKLKEILT